MMTFARKVMSTQLRVSSRPLVTEGWVNVKTVAEETAKRRLRTNDSRKTMR